MNQDKYFIAGDVVDDALTASNMYAYCNNNPVMLVDPTGMAPKSATPLDWIFFVLGVGWIIEFFAGAGMQLPELFVTVSDMFSNFFQIVTDRDFTPFEANLYLWGSIQKWVNGIETGLNLDSIAGSGLIGLAAGGIAGAILFLFTAPVITVPLFLYAVAELAIKGAITGAVGDLLRQLFKFT